MSARVSLATVIPTHQRAATIVRAVESVLAQTYEPSEVIVVDDGSTDATQELLRPFRHRIRIVAQRQSGSASARNLGVQLASADWISFLDSDDYWEPDHLESVSEAIRRTSGAADLYFRDTEVALEDFTGAGPRLTSGLLWRIAGFEPCEDVTLVADGSLWALLPTQPMMVQSSVVNRRRYLELDGMWSALKLRHDTHFFFRASLGRPICAVAGVGARMTDDAIDGRLTRDVSPNSPDYWEETRLMYADLMTTNAPCSLARSVIREELAAAQWRIARLRIWNRDVSAISSLWELCRTQPTFIPRRVGTKLVAGTRSTQTT